MTRFEETDMQTKRQWKKSSVCSQCNQPTNPLPSPSIWTNEQRKNEQYVLTFESEGRCDYKLIWNAWKEKKEKEKRVKTINVQ